MINSKSRINGGLGVDWKQGQASKGARETPLVVSVSRQNPVWRFAVPAVLSPVPAGWKAPRGITSST